MFNLGIIGSVLALVGALILVVVPLVAGGKVTYRCLGCGVIFEPEVGLPDCSKCGSTNIRLHTHVGD